ncbi:MAG: alpha-amylase family glycosyl hydrolase [Myxococcaceae bacterium]
MRSVIALCALLLATGCVKHPAPTRLAEPSKIAIAYVVDGASGVADAPESVKQEVEAGLQSRNLVPARIPFEGFEAAFSASADSAKRFTFAEGLAGDAPLLLLVELRAEFFSQLQGQYRWQVYGKFSSEKSTAAQPVTETFDVPAMMLFDHQRTPEVLMSKSPAIAEQAGFVVDQVIRAAGALTPKSPTKLDSDMPQISPKKKEGQPEQQQQPSGALRRDAIYFVMVDRFANGDRANDGVVDLADPNAFHGGDLQGVIDHLGELKALGIETVWLSPVFKMRTEKFFGYGAFHGYWTYDLTKVEPRFGSEATLRKLSDEVHARGMKLVLDLVLNHVGPDAPLVKEHPSWFHNQGPLENWNDPKELVNKDVLGLPDFAQENEEVYQYLLGASLKWIDSVHPDGFRLDAVKHVPLTFWARFNADVKAHAGNGFMLLGEMLDGDAANLAKTMEQGGFTHMFDFPLHFAIVDTFCKGQSPARLAATLSQDRMYEHPEKLVTLVDNHDLPRIASLCHAETDNALRFQLTARGVPSLIWGTEVGLEGEKEPANRGDMKFGAQGPPFETISSVLRERSSLAPFRDGVPYLLALDDAFFAYARLDANGAALVLVDRTIDKPANPRTRPFELNDPLFRVANVTELHAGDRSDMLFVLHDRVVTYGLAPRDGYSALYEAARHQWETGAIHRPVHISATAPAEKGDAVFLVGSGKELGAWNPANGLGPLKSGQLDASLPEGFAYEYKLVIRRSDGRTEWEPGANRALFVNRAKEPLQLSLKWAERNG